MITLSLFHVFIIVFTLIICVYLLIKFTRIRFVIDNNSYQIIRNKIINEITEDFRQKIFAEQEVHVRSSADDSPRIKSFSIDSYMHHLDSLKTVISTELYDEIKNQISASKTSRSEWKENDVPEFNLDDQIEGISK